MLLILCYIKSIIGIVVFFMARHLSHIAAPLRRYLNHRFTTRWRLDKGVDLTHISALPAPLFVAYMRGDAILKTAFFERLNNKHIHNLESLKNSWLQVIDGGHAIEEIIERSGATQFFCLDNQHNYRQQCYSAYCIILWDAALNSRGLLDKLTQGLVDHYLPTFYPNKAKPKTPEQFKKDIAKLLAGQWNLRAVIKESFTTSDTEVKFSLLAKLQRYKTLPLLTLKGEKLKATRLKAYKQCIEQLEKKSMPMPIPMVKRKQES